MTGRNLLVEVVVVAFPTGMVDYGILVVGVACGSASCDAWDLMAFQIEVVAYCMVVGKAF